MNMRGLLFGSPSATVASLCLGVVVIVAISGESISPWGAMDSDWDNLEAGPSAEHWLGTDLIGRDLLARIAIGAQTSILAALIATSVSVVIGVPYGALAGFVGGRTDQWMMRWVDTLYALPFILLVILLVTVFGRNTYFLFAALGAVFWLDIARIVRGQALSLKQQGFVDAARGMGASNLYIVARHIVPNTWGPALVYATLTVPGVILAESFLSFLGLGVQEPDTSWGMLIADGMQALESAPWTLLFPAAFLAATVWSLNMLGDRLRDALDTRLSSQQARP